MVAGAKRCYFVECIECGIRVDFFMDPKGVVAWQEGELIQNALPDLTAEERELLISRYCNKCFIKFTMGAVECI